MASKFWLLILLVAVGLPATQGQRANTIEWNVPEMGILPSDKIEIVKLARKVGIEPGQVGVLTLLPSGERTIFVNSAVLGEGKHRSWLEISVCRADWQHCNNRASRPITQVGRWLARKQQLARRETWKIQDGSWTSDVPIEPGISFADTERIVLAIRRKQLVNRLPAFRTMPTDFTGITYIRRIPPETATYEIQTGVAGGEILRVR